MKQNIRFRGLSFNRDEQSADHGELSLCAGVELHDGALRPSVLDGSMVSDTALTGTLLYVHETPSYRHYISKEGTALYWDGSNDPIKTFSQDDGEDEEDDGDVISVNSVGNTLLVMTKNTGIHYILWKETDYKYLGTQIPFLPIEFRPTEQYKAKYDRSTINSDQVGSSLYAWRKLSVKATDAMEANSDNQTVRIKADHQATFTEGVHAIVNQSNNTVAKDGHFYAPFLLRYCYRLYDGSMVMHSAPIFMNVAHPESLKVYCTNVNKRWKIDGQPVADGDIYIGSPEGGINVTYSEDSHDYTFHVEGDETVLQYVPNNVGIEYHIRPEEDSPDTNDILEDLKDDWSDIVKSVDIFVSAPLLREDFSDKITQLKVEEDTYGVRSSILSKFYGKIAREYTEQDVTVTYLCNLIFDFPKLSDDAYLQKILNTSNFFKIASYKLEDLEVDINQSHQFYKELKYDKSVIPNITIQEEMKDDYNTHNQLLPINSESGMYVYNHRLNLYGMKEKLFEGFSMYDMINWTNSTDPASVAKISDITVEIDTEDGKKYVKEEYSYLNIPLYNITKGFLFYPDSRATKMYINYTSGQTAITAVLPMEPLNFLNGAVAVGAFFKENLNDFVTNPAVTPPSVNNIVSLPNRIITSEVDNPYYFPLEGRNAVGVGSVIGIAAVTRALSQGQVGDHDLVVFSTDGIWVLKVSSTGTYMAAHNISREVCSNPRSICQLDQSIIFATQRSLSKFVESDVASISDVLDGPIPALASLLPGLADDVANTDLATLLGFGTPAVELFNNGRVFYDYASSRIVVLQANTASDSVALVFSIRDMAWSSMMVPGILSVIPGYPSPYVQTTDGKVMVLNKQYGYSGDTRHDGLIITRTLTFSDTMDIIRGFRQLTDSATMPTLYFYGSNNQRDWKLIGCTGREFYEYMPGHPYRFFRVAIKMSLLPSEEYQQLELEIISKYAKL